MTDNESTERQAGEHGGTSPDAENPGEATSPPLNPEVDEDAVEEGREKLDQAGAGH